MKNRPCKDGFFRRTVAISASPLFVWLKFFSNRYAELTILEVRSFYQNAP